MLRTLLTLLALGSAAAFAPTLALRPTAAVARSLPVVASALEDSIKSTIGGSKVVMYSKSYCPFCIKTKDLLGSIGAEYSAIELDLMDGGAELQDALAGFSGQRTVPNVFIDGKHIGGCDDTFKLFESGELEKLLK